MTFQAFFVNAAGVSHGCCTNFADLVEEEPMQLAAGAFRSDYASFTLCVCFSQMVTKNQRPLRWLRLLQLLFL
jgi:hypothetical protein